MNNASASPRVAALNWREHGVILLALLAMTVIAWLYLLTVNRGMSDTHMDGMPGMAMPMTAAWTPATFALTFAMWWVMMLGMMVPSNEPGLRPA